MYFCAGGDEASAGILELPLLECRELQLHTLSNCCRQKPCTFNSRVEGVPSPSVSSAAFACDDECFNRAKTALKKTCGSPKTSAHARYCSTFLLAFFLCVWVSDVVQIRATFLCKMFFFACTFHRASFVFQTTAGILTSQAFPHSRCVSPSDILQSRPISSDLVHL